jgi:hypothetical protein
VLTGTVTPESSGFTFKNNIFTDIGIGIRLDAPVSPTASFQDVTAEGNKFTNVPGGAIDMPVTPVGFRADQDSQRWYVRIGSVAEVDDH